MPPAKKIRLYTLSTCSHCNRTKKFFKDSGIEVEFTDVDLLTGEQREKVMEEVRKVNPECTFPTICIDEGRCGLQRRAHPQGAGRVAMTAEELHPILSRYAESQGIRLNKDRDFVLDILRGLLTNERDDGRGAPEHRKPAPSDRDPRCSHAFELEI